MSSGQQLIVVVATMHQAHAFGLGTVHYFTKHDTGKRGLRADDATQHPGVTAAGVNADLEKARVELGAPRGQPHIATEGEIHSSADRCAIDRGQRRQRAARNS